MSHRSQFFIALDGMSRKRALSLTKRFAHSRSATSIAGFKIHDLWDACGPSIVRDLKRAGAKVVWVDLKLHDTPNTIRLRTTAVKKAGADIISVHAGSGERGLRAAKLPRMKVVAITVLTSLDKKEARHIYASSSARAVQKLFALAQKAGVWSVVSSAEELAHTTRSRIKTIVPGIRANGGRDSNQKRTGTPHDTLSQGADYLVLGSIVTHAKDPLEALGHLQTGAMLPPAHF